MNKICHVNSLCHLFSWGKEGRIYNKIEETNIFYFDLLSCHELTISLSLDNKNFKNHRMKKKYKGFQKLRHTRAFRADNNKN